MRTLSLAGCVAVFSALALGPVGAIHAQQAHAQKTTIWSGLPCTTAKEESIHAKHPFHLLLEVDHTAAHFNELTVYKGHIKLNTNQVWRWNHPPHWISGRYEQTSPRLEPGSYLISYRPAKLIGLGCHSWLYEVSVS